MLKNAKIFLDFPLCVLAVTKTILAVAKNVLVFLTMDQQLVTPECYF